MYRINKVSAYNVFMISCLILCLECGDRKQGKKEEDIVKINIDMDKITKPSFLEWFSEIEVIPLETNENSLLRYNKLIPYNHRYYIHDTKQAALFVFDSIGKFLYTTLFYEGQGPEDCLMVHDFTINPATGNLDILIPLIYTIQIRDTDGQFIKNIKYPEYMVPISTFEAVSEDLYFFYCPIKEPDKEWLRLFSVNENKVIKRMFKKQKYHSFPAATQVFYRYNGLLYFSFGFPNNDVYQMDENMDFKRSVSYDYGRYTFDIDKLPINNDKVKVYHERPYGDYSDKYALSIYKSENKRFFFCFYYFKDEIYIHRKNKITNEEETIPVKFRDGERIFPPHFLDDDYFYYVAEPSWFRAMLPLDHLPPSVRTVVAGVKEDDNPVILKFKLK